MRYTLAVLALALAILAPIESAAQFHKKNSDGSTRITDLRLDGLVQRVYNVPDDFMSLGKDIDVERLITARDVLESHGILFTEGCTAIYIRSSSKIVVRNTPEQIERVIELLSEWDSKFKTPVTVTVQTVYSDEPIDYLPQTLKSLSERFPTTSGMPLGHPKPLATRTVGAHFSEAVFFTPSQMESV
ncbi:MAG: hypothetical protein AAF226_11460, partial [Verrucomicrobiota bacterium]